MHFGNCFHHWKNLAEGTKGAAKGKSDIHTHFSLIHWVITCAIRAPELSGASKPGRPLACRIFPLTPVLSDDGKLDIIIDPRSKSICPLGQAFTLDDFEPQFIKNVKKAFIMLCKNKEFAKFMVEYTKYIKDFQKFI